MLWFASCRRNPFTSKIAPNSMHSALNHRHEVSTHPNRSDLTGHFVALFRTEPASTKGKEICRQQFASVKKSKRGKKHLAFTAQIHLRLSSEWKEQQRGHHQQLTSVNVQFPVQIHDIKPFIEQDISIPPSLLSSVGHPDRGKEYVILDDASDKYRRLKSACVYWHNLILYLLGEKKYIVGHWNCKITLILAHR